MHMPNLLWVVCASTTVSLISLIGISALLFNERRLNDILVLFIGFAAGGLIGASFLHILPEAIENLEASTVFLNVILGLIFFFILERYLHWRHCHDGRCDIHVFTYLNLIGDGVHNFIDGLIIGASFITNIHLGVITTFAIILHEIPQEVSDFGVLVYGGFSKFKAIAYNFIFSLTAVFGSVLGYYFSRSLVNFAKVLLPFAAGGFIYIACCDLIPELHKEKDSKKVNYSIVFFLLGILVMFLLRTTHHH